MRRRWVRRSLTQHAPDTSGDQHTHENDDVGNRVECDPRPRFPRIIISGPFVSDESSVSGRTRDRSTSQTQGPRGDSVMPGVRRVHESQGGCRKDLAQRIVAMALAVRLRCARQRLPTERARHRHQDAQGRSVYGHQQMLASTPRLRCEYPARQHQTRRRPSTGLAPAWESLVIREGHRKTSELLPRSSVAS